MEELHELKSRMEQERPARWEELPDLALYMDQIVSYMPRQLIHFDQGETLTSAMVNNYIKDALLPRAEGKRYHQAHLAYLTAICVLKQVMSTRDMDLLIKQELQGERSVADGYAAFCESLVKALNITADEMELYLDESTLADAAIHFALLSYAAGVASNRYVSLLRQQQEAEGAETENRRKDRRKEKEKDEHA